MLLTTTYEDRKESAFVGIYSGTVEEQHFPHVMPQENGNKTTSLTHTIIINLKIKEK